MKKTMDALDLLHERIVSLQRAFEYEGSILNDDFTNAFQALIFDLEDAENDKQISKQMADKYKELLYDLNYDTGNKIQKLLTLNNNYEKDVGEADKKLEKSIGVIGNIMQWQDENDDKTALADVQNLMGLFEQSYNDVGALNSVDALCKVGDAIKKSLEEKKISRKTAEELMKPLEEIKDNMFDEQLCDKKISEFKESLQDVLGKDGREQGGMQQQTQSTNIITDAALLARNIGNAAVNIAKGIKEANKKIDDKAKAAADEYDKKQQREMTAQDIVQSQADDKRKLPEDQAAQDKVADKQGIKKENPQQKKEQITPEQALENIENLARRYQGLYAKAGSIMNNPKGLGHAKDELLSSIKYVVDNKLVSPEVAKSLQESFKYMMENALHSQRHMQGLQRIGQIVSKERKNYTDEQGVKQENGTLTDLHESIMNYKTGVAQNSFDNPDVARAEIINEINTSMQNGVISQNLADSLIKQMVATEKSHIQPIMPEPKKAQDAKAKEKSELSPVEKGNKFKEGIINVLNKQRDEKSQNRIHDDKEKQDAFVQMLRRKKLKGVVE